MTMTFRPRFICVPTARKKTSCQYLSLESFRAAAAYPAMPEMAKRFSAASTGLLGTSHQRPGRERARYGSLYVHSWRVTLQHRLDPFPHTDYELLRLSGASEEQFALRKDVQVEPRTNTDR